MSAYYNESDPYAAQWLRNLIAAGHIAPGDVDERSIADVRADDLKGYVQCHFFAGIGVWSHALRTAGWPDDRPVWTGSCPCQPFSAAGKGEGTADPRHLWPSWFRLVREHRPVAIFGEQVGAAIRHGWLDLVQADLEGLDYAFGSAVVGAHSVGAPHIRQRLFFVAESSNQRHEWAGRAWDGRDGSADIGAACELADALPAGRPERRPVAGGGSPAGGCGSGVALGDAVEQGLEGLAGHGGDGHEPGRLGADAARSVAEASGAGGVGNAAAGACERGAGAVPATEARLDGARLAVDGGLSVGLGDAGQGVGSFWTACDWLPCIDGKARPVEPGTFPLAHGAPARVGRLRAYGNAIVPQVAAEVIGAFMECRP